MLRRTALKKPSLVHPRMLLHRPYPKPRGGVEDYDPHNFKTCYFDDYSGEPLPLHLVRRAIADSLSYVTKVWEAVDIQEAQKAPDHNFIRARWVMRGKGDDAHPDVRARLVACGTNNNKSQPFFAFTPSHRGS